jgi:hypothetical protein
MVNASDHSRCSTNNPKIPKPNEVEGLSIGWPQQKIDMDKLKDLFAEIKSKM